jgi:hypothetical protein
VDLNWPGGRSPLPAGGSIGPATQGGSGSMEANHSKSGTHSLCRGADPCLEHSWEAAAAAEQHDNSAARVDDPHTGGVVFSPPPPTSLDTQETNDEMWSQEELAAYEPPRDDYQIEPLLPAEASFRHGGWKRTRARIFDALVSLHISATRLERFACCGSGCRVLYHPEQQALRLAGNYCHDRFCIPCGAARARTIARVLAAHCGARPIRFLTLTLRHSPTALGDQIDRLYDSFRRLRNRKAWKAHVAGGAAFIELKLGRDGLWHPHLHCLIDGDFWSQKEIAEQWHAVTGDSYIIDIRKPDSQSSLVNYVCKYASKPMETSAIRNPSRLAEAITSLRGRRLCLTFGTFRGLVLEPHEECSDGWIVMGRLSDLIQDARRSDPEAIRLLEALHRRYRTLLGPSP